MRRFIIEQSEDEFYTSHSGLALAGLCVSRYTNIDKALKKIPLRHGITHGDMAKSYVGQVCLGKNDFEAVSQVRDDDFFKHSLGIKKVPSPERLRQRFDDNANAMMPIIDEVNIDFMVKAAVPVTALKTGHVALDIDVFPMDNSGTKKEGVSRTYKGHDGYAPIAAYLGNEGWCLGNELREGSQHSQKDFLDFSKHIIPRTRRLTEAPILTRLDSAHDALENRAWFTEEGIDFLIKWNPRKEKHEYWLNRAESEGDSSYYYRKSRWKGGGRL